MANDTTKTPAPYPVGSHVPALTPEQQEAAAKVREEAKAAAIQGVEDRAAAVKEQVAANEERTAKAKPTPTQRESDLARVGALDIDSKEDDGSGSDEDYQRRTMEGRLPSGNPYTTRKAKAK